MFGRAAITLGIVLHSSISNKVHVCIVHNNNFSAALVQPGKLYAFGKRSSSQQGILEGCGQIIPKDLYPFIAIKSVFSVNVRLLMT